MAITTSKTPAEIWRGADGIPGYEPSPADQIEHLNEIIARVASQADLDTAEAAITVLENRDFNNPNPKDAVALATTANVTLSGEQTLDGTLTSASRVLVKNQTDASENGPYVTGSGAWLRATDFDADAECPFATFYVTGGTANGGTRWMANVDAVTLGTTDIPFVQIADDAGLQGQVDTVAADILERPTVAAAALLMGDLRTVRPNANNPAALIRTHHGFLIRQPLIFGSGFNEHKDAFCEHEIIDIGPFIGFAAGQSYMSLISKRAEYQGRERRALEQSFASQSPGSVNTGFTPSVSEFAVDIGDSNDAVNETNFKFAGGAHARMAFVSSQLFLDGGGTDMLPIAQMPVGETWFGASISFQQIVHLLTPHGEIACRSSLNTTFLSGNASGQLQYANIHEFGHADTTVTPAVRTMYGTMNPSTLHTHAKARGQTAVDISAIPLGNNHQWGQTDLVASYHVDDPNMLFETLSGYGNVPCRINDVDDTSWSLCDPAQYVHTEPTGYGSKGYGGVVTQASGAGTATTITDKITTLYFHRVRIATPD